MFCLQGRFILNSICLLDPHAISESVLSHLYLSRAVAIRIDWNGLETTGGERNSRQKVSKYWHGWNLPIKSTLISLHQYEKNPCLKIIPWELAYVYLLQDRLLLQLGWPFSIGAMLMSHSNCTRIHPKIQYFRSEPPTWIVTLPALGRWTVIRRGGGGGGGGYVFGFKCHGIKFHHPSPPPSLAMSLKVAEYPNFV